MMRYTLIILCSCTLIGCVSQRQKQNASDAVAGISAIERAAPVSARPVAEGARHYVAAAVKMRADELPPPTLEPSEILAAPDKYRDAGKQAEEDASAGFWAVIGGGVLGFLGLAARFGPLFGPVGSTVSSAINGVLGICTPKKQQEAQRKAQIMEESAWQMVKQIEAWGHDDPVIKELKKRISEATPAEFNAFFDAWKKSREGAQ